MSYTILDHLSETVESKTEAIEIINFLKENWNIKEEKQ